jgi:hypothetical protein
LACGSIVALAVILSQGGAAGAAALSQPPPPPPRLPPSVFPLPSATHTLRVETIPVVPGAVFAFNGTLFQSDPSGVASVVIGQSERGLLSSAADTHLAVLTPDVVVGEAVRARFTGWSANATFLNGLETRVATFALDYLSTFRFENPVGRGLAPSQVRTLQLQNDAGATIDVSPTHPVWLPGTEIRTGDHGPVSAPIAYRVTKAVVRGVTVHDGGRQQFSPTQDTHPTVKLALYSVRFVATDAILGHRLGNALDLRFPDGTTRRVALSHHSVTLHDLPPGTYDVAVVGGTLGLARTFAVSRNAEFDVAAFSYRALAGGCALIAVLIAAVLLSVARSRRRARAASIAASKTPSSRHEPMPRVRPRFVLADSPSPVSSRADEDFRTRHLAHGSRPHPCPECVPRGSAGRDA